MATSYFSGEESENDRDDSSFNEDMEALQRACLLAGKDPNHLRLPSSSPSAAADPESSDTDGVDDDIELVRRIQQRFSFPSQSAFVRPLDVRSPSASEASDADDDFETLRAIQRRFSHYDGGGLLKNENNLQRDELVSSTILKPGQEGSNILLRPTSNDEMGGAEFLDSGTSICTPQSSGHVNRNSESLCSGSTEWQQQVDTLCNLSATPHSNSSFPRFAQMFTAAIKKNRSLQKFIRSKLIQIEAKISEVKELKDRVKCLMSFQTACRRKATKLLNQRKDPRVKLISLPKLDRKGFDSLGPVENFHVANYRMVISKFPLMLNRRQWSETEKENLAKGIKQQYQEMLLRKPMEECSDLEGSFRDVNDLDSIIASINDLEITPESIRCFLPNVDWDRLASIYVKGRSGAECETRWLNHEDPLINHNPWTHLEDKHLLYIVKNRGIYNWIEIAKLMGISRTPFQCLSRYQRSLNADMLKSDWTEDEDAQLRAIVEMVGEGDWQAVANALEGRTGTQCSNRWKKSLHPSRQRVGRWSMDEDKRLKICVMLFGPKSWNKIAGFVPGRTQVQCRERWFNVLDPSLKCGPWAEEEDSKLIVAISEHGHCWSKIAGLIPGRTDNHCRRRWKVLFPHEVPLLQAARKIQKVALRTNFVDRERLRPALGPCDFVSTSIEAEAESKAAKSKERKRSCDDPQSSCSKKSRTRKGKTPAAESLGAGDGDAVLTCHEDGVKSISKKTRKKPPMVHPDEIACVQGAEDNGDLLPENDILSMLGGASQNGSSRPNDVSQMSETMRSRRKDEVPLKEVAGVECDINAHTLRGDNNRLMTRSRKKKPPKRNPSGLKYIEPVQVVSDQASLQNAICSTVDCDISLAETRKSIPISQESKSKRSREKLKVTARRVVAGLECDGNAMLASVSLDGTEKSIPVSKVSPQSVVAGVGCDDDAMLAPVSLDGTGKSIPVSQQSKLKRSRAKLEASAPRVSAGVECDDDAMLASVSLDGTEKSIPVGQVTAQRVVAGVECADDAMLASVSMDGTGKSIPVSQESKLKRSRAKLEVLARRVVADVECDNNATLASVSLDGTGKSMPVSQEAKPKGSRARLKVTARRVVVGVELDDNATLASVFSDIVKRKRLKAASVTGSRPNYQ